MMLTIPFFFRYWSGVIVCNLLITAAVLGFIDDRRDLSPKLKLIVQIAIGGIAFWSGISSETMLEWMGISSGYGLGLMFTVLLIIAYMNAFNLIDGIDGLSSGIALLNFGLFIPIFYILEEQFFLMLTLGLFGSVLAFLRFNFHPAKIFMGDTGSLLLGLFNIICTLKITSEGSTMMGIIAFGTLMLPFMDMLRLFVGRILTSKSPFKADKNHYHHLLIALAWDHRKASIAMYGVHLFLIGASYMLSRTFPAGVCLFLIPILGLWSFALIQFLRSIKLRRRVKESKKSAQVKIERNHLLERLL